MPDQEREAVARELAKHRSTLFAFILSIVRDFDLAAEVFGEVASSLSGRAGEFRPGTNFGAWALRVARDAIDRLAPDADRDVFLSRDAIEAVERAAEAEPPGPRLDALRTVRDGLRGQTRSVLAMRYRDGLSGRGIARRTKTTATKVHAALSRARGALAAGVPAVEEPS